MSQNISGAAECFSRIVAGRLLNKPPENADFARLLYAARPSNRGQYARAVLVHYTRLHPAEADRLIRWLHDGGPEQQLLAARLLAGHVPAGANVTDAFLTTVRAWAMANRYPGLSILVQASRAIHHPGLASWLGDLMGDTHAPWLSRVEAATALATRVRGVESSAAIATLRSVVDDTAIPVTHRLSAAEALSECGAEQRVASENGLRAVLADPSATAVDFRNAAMVLAGFGPEARAYAVGALTATLDDPWTPDADLVEMAAGLIEIGVEFHDRCADVLSAVLRRRTDFVTRQAATRLAELGPERVTDAVRALTSTITDPGLNYNDRIIAAETLATLGPQHRITASEHLLSMSTEFDIDPSGRWRLANALATAGFHDRTIEMLRGVLTDRSATNGDRLSAARTLADLGPEHQEETTRVYRRIAGSPVAAAGHRAQALARLATAGEPHRTESVAALRRLLSDRAIGPMGRCLAAQELAGLSPDFHDEAAKCLLGIISGQADPAVRGNAWRALRDLDTTFRIQGSKELLALLGPDEAASWVSHRDYWIPNRFDTDDHTAFADVLTATLRDPARTGEARACAAAGLISLGRGFHRSAVDGLIGLLQSEEVPAFDLSWVVGLCASVGSGGQLNLDPPPGLE